MCSVQYSALRRLMDAITSWRAFASCKVVLSYTRRLDAETKWLGEFSLGADMKTNKLVATLTAALLTFSSLGFTKDHDDGRRRNDREWSDDDRGDQRGGHGNRRGGQRGHERGYERGQQYGGPPQAFRDERRDRGAGPYQNYYRGQRLPSYYRNNTYVVNDWRGHRLSAPPRGYHWVQTGSDYVLVAIATGIILQIMLSQ
jgi:Ni/Co efflux regulator RcnB